MTQKFSAKDIKQDDRSFNTYSFWANILIGLSPIWLSTLFIFLLRKYELLSSVIQGELAIYNISTLFVIVYGMINKQRDTVFDKIYEIFDKQHMIKFERPEIPAKNLFSISLPFLIIISMALYAIEKLNQFNVLTGKISVELLNWLTVIVFLITAISSYFTGLFERINPFKDRLFKLTEIALTKYKEEKEEQNKIKQLETALSSGRLKQGEKLSKMFEKERRNQEVRSKKRGEK